MIGHLVDWELVVNAIKRANDYGKDGITVRPMLHLATSATETDKIMMFIDDTTKEATHDK